MAYKRKYRSRRKPRRRYKNARRTYRKARKSYRRSRRTYRRGGYGRGGNFRRRVTSIISKNLGLHTWQTFVAGELFTGIPSVTGRLQPQISPNIASPANLLTSGMIVGNDNKTFLKRASHKIWLYNKLNTPCIIRCTWIRCKRNIPTAGWGSLTSLLQDEAPTIAGNAYGDNFTGNTAQRMLKWLKTKEKVLYPGRMCKFSVKKTYNRNISGDTDAPVGIFATPLTRFMYITAWGAPLENDDSSEWGPGPVGVNFIGREQYWWNKNEDATNTSTTGQAQLILSAWKNIPAETTDQPVDEQD